ncbi:MAG TPA: hypothetical protein VHB99_12910, partial [Pirellulales bacterium]|nr:hypothetical protein [Pirellulales bacterium]
PQYLGESRMTTKEQEVYLAAEQLFHRNLDWVTFYRETLGVDGIVRKVFPSKEDMAAFEQCREYEAIQLMVAKLRGRGNLLPQPQEATRVITVRLPQSLHDSLRIEAHQMQTSMNKLCISKLMQLVDGQLVPTDVLAKAQREAEETEEALEAE